MRMKVGSMLVQERIITEAELEEALRNQVIFGGKIGTNLVELGYITAERLCEALSRHNGFPQVNISHLHSVPPDVIALITSETAKKYMAIPVSLEKKRLTVAMADPNNLDAIDKLSFMTGMYINPVVIPELLLFMALERYYKIRRETRYIPIAQDMKRFPRQLDSSGETNEIKPPKAVEKIIEVKVEEAEEEFIEIPEFDGFDKVEIPDAPEPVKTIAPRDEAANAYNMTDLCSALAGATAREQIGEALMEYLRSRHFRSALFLPKEPVLTGWLATDEKGYLENFSEVRVDMQQPSSFLQVIESKSFCMGQLLSPTDFKIASVVGAHDNPAILLPIILMNRVVAILCVIDTLEKLTRSLNELQKIAVKSAMAFEILIMRNKIQMV
ncbi:MAG: hypothetical protein HXX17_01830 [Geobacteraceae bacterium]|nr:hypothetical protein [Geobacteraceae bacterium]